MQGPCFPGIMTAHRAFNIAPVAILLVWSKDSFSPEQALSSPPVRTNPFLPFSIF